MKQLLQGIPTKAVYLDDIVCTGRTEESRANLISILDPLQTAGLRLKLDKCEFPQPSCIYLGHRLAIHPTNEKVRVIADAPVPRDQRDVKSYLGMVCYYHKFLHNLSANWPSCIISYRTSPGSGAQLSKLRVKSQRGCFSQQKYKFTMTRRCLSYSRATHPPME